MVQNLAISGSKSSYGRTQISLMVHKFCYISGTKSRYGMVVQTQVMVVQKSRYYGGTKSLIYYLEPTPGVK